MATPSLVKAPLPRGIVAVVIELDANGNIVVEPDPFWVRKSADQEVKWFCSGGHDHKANKPCFTVDFDAKDKPFDEKHFEHHRAHSGCATVEGDKNKKYKYTVKVGDKTLDPTGGVEP